MAVGIALLTGWGCSRGPSRLKPPKIDASAAGRQAVSQYDTDGDGTIGTKELSHAPALAAALQNLDTSGEGRISAEEVAARITAWQSTKLGRMPVTCRVVCKGRPVAGSTVTFVPEKFLEANLAPSTGTTDQYGMARVSLPDTEPPGVPCGLYRVVISKKQGGRETVPPAYNRHTTLGLEVAPDAKGFGKVSRITFHIE